MRHYCAVIQPIWLKEAVSTYQVNYYSTYLVYYYREIICNTYSGYCLIGKITILFIRAKVWIDCAEGIWGAQKQKPLYLYRFSRGVTFILMINILFIISIYLLTAYTPYI